MIKIGLIREGKIPADNRVALTPAQCRWVQQHYPNVSVVVQHSESRCFSDHEYSRHGIAVVENLAECSIILGIKEVPIHDLLPDKTYLFFSHTKKKQPHNQALLQAILQKKITLIDYECLEHEDGQRIIGFGFFAGVVGAHNGMMAYGNRTGSFSLERVYKQKSLRKLIHTYFDLKLPNIKIAVTGSGRVAHGILEVMNLMGVTEVEKEMYLQKKFTYPIYVHLKGADLYEHKTTVQYNRDHFHQHPNEYKCLFSNYIPETDILMNGVYWEAGIPRLFEAEDIARNDFKISVIADVTDDTFGSVPINLGDQNIEHPVYGVDRKTSQRTEAGLSTSIDVMAVSNLPNELPRDASRYFGQQLIKFIFPALITGSSRMIDKATIVQNGELTPPYLYLQDYAFGNKNS